MKKHLFHENWLVTERKGMFGLPQSSEPEKVILPYDAMIFTERKENAPFASGNYALGKWEYEKHFFLSEDYKNKKVYFQFDGVYQNALIYINGEFAANRANGYAQFFVDATHLVRCNAENEIRVVVQLADGARWYSGAGIYRDVYLLTSELVHILPHGVKVSTPAADEELADVVIATTVKNSSARAMTTVRVETKLIDPTGKVAAENNAPLTILQGQEAVLRQRLWIEKPQLWELDVPALYECHTAVYGEEGELLDESCESFGIRTFRLSAARGLSMNGRPIKLMGCGIHHENGPVGAISMDSIEERKVAKLKEAGFNAIRMAHNPASEALLRACDKYGMLVMNEAFDTWTVSKVDFDNTLMFQKTWKEDLKSMVDASYNHPCVLMYSIGNEIADTGTPTGAARGREIVEYLRSLDNTRYVINCINGLVAVMELLQKMASDASSQRKEEGQNAINSMMNSFGDTMKQIAALDVVTNAIEEACSYLDIAGYNYMDSRYEADHERFPNRVICGTETFVPTIDQNWKKVKENPHVIGDFCWTGWDYCGEPGTGLVKYEAPPFEYGMGLPFPCLLSEVGEFTISGFRRPCSYYHEIVLGHRSQPYIAVQRPEHYYDEAIETPWSWSDSVGIWSFFGKEGEPVRVEVYSDAEEVELSCNGKVIGRHKTGEADHYKTIFDTVFEPGELKAVAFTDGKESGSFILRSAKGQPGLKAAPEKDSYSFGKREVIYLPISAADEEGEIFIGNKAFVRAEVEGPAEFMGFGTDDPVPAENFKDHGRTLYDGRALLVLRPAGAGKVRVRLSAEGMEDTVVHIDVEA